MGCLSWPCGLAGVCRVGRVRDAGAGVEFGAGIGRDQFRQQSGELLPAVGPAPGSALPGCALWPSLSEKRLGLLSPWFVREGPVPATCTPLLGAESWPALRTACFSSPPVSVSLSRFHCF